MQEHKDHVDAATPILTRAASRTIGGIALSALALCGLAGMAHANLIYDFNIGAASGLNAFSFSFTVPSFVGEGQSPAFTPFNVTDGTHTWTMIDDLTGHSSGVPPLGCFMFDNGGTSSFFPPCSVTVPGPTDGGLALLTNTLSMPTATGAYSLSGGGALKYPGGLLLPTFTGTLDITSTAVPEPASISLLGIAVATLGWKLRIRLVASRISGTV